MPENKIKSFLNGDLSKELLIKRLIPITMIIMGLSILFSNLLFPEAFDWRYMVISDLTSSTHNPDGFLVLSIGMAICGVLLIPLAGYMHKKLAVICRGTAIIGTLFFYVGIIGLISVGLIYDAPGQPNRLHENLAIVAFAGLLLSIFFWGFPMMKGRKQFDTKKMVFAFGMMWFAVLGVALSSLYLEIVPNDWGWVGIDWIEKGAPVLASFALWEWIAFMSLLVYIILLVDMTPEIMEPLRKNKSVDNQIEK